MLEGRTLDSHFSSEVFPPTDLIRQLFISSLGFLLELGKQQQPQQQNKQKKPSDTEFH